LSNGSVWSADGPATLQASEEEAPMPPRDAELLTVAEVALRWHVSVRTVQRWIADGKLKAVLLPSGRYRIRPADADAALRET
jgi:excisionase family DNA binding protein